jgi:hypothetical protein
MSQGRELAMMAAAAVSLMEWRSEMEVVAAVTAAVVTVWAAVNAVVAAAEAVVVDADVDEEGSGV